MLTFLGWTARPWLRGATGFGALVGLLAAFEGCGETRLHATFLADGGTNGSATIGGAPAEELREQETQSGGASSSLGGQPGSGGTPAYVKPAEPLETLTVGGGFLRDHCGNKFIPRGVNEMVIWSEGRDGDPEFFEIAKTGANAVRVVWLLDGTPEELDVALGNARAEQLVPVLEFHDGFRDESDAFAVSEVADYLTSPPVVDILSKYEDALIVEIEGRFGESAPPSEWEAIHKEAIARLREAGIRVPIAINEPSWDEDVEEVVSRVKTVVDSDPLDNSLYSAAVWSGTADDFRSTLVALQEIGVPLYLAEFSGWEVANCPSVATDVSALMAICEEFGAGWFAWSWGGVQNLACSEGGAHLDMSSDGTLDGLVNWGRIVALEDPNGISRTAVRLRTIGIESCEDL